MISNKINSLTELSYAYKKGNGGNYIGFLLDFPGVMSQASTEKELLDNLLDALACMMAYEERKRLSAVPSYLFDDTYVKSTIKMPAVA